jgi:DnaJ-domain-containing protein 1
VLQGLREMAEDNRSLARLQLTEIPPAPRGAPQIQVRFELDADAILRVTARELAERQGGRDRRQPASGLTRAEVEALAQEAEDARQAGDLARRAAALLRNRAETLAYACERALEGYADSLPAAVLAAVKRDLEVLRTRLDAHAEPADLQPAFLALERSSRQIYAAMLGDSEPPAEPDLAAGERAEPLPRVHWFHRGFPRMSYQDHYAVLGVAASASQDEIKAAYRRLALATHPDRHPDDPDAEARFRAISTAYAVLSDPPSAPATTPSACSPRR